MFNKNNQFFFDYQRFNKLLLKNIIQAINFFNNKNPGRLQYCSIPTSFKYEIKYTPQKLSCEAYSTQKDFRQTSIKDKKKRAESQQTLAQQQLMSNYFEDQHIKNVNNIQDIIQNQEKIALQTNEYYERILEQSKLANYKMKRQFYEYYVEQLGQPHKFNLASVHNMIVPTGLLPNHIQRMAQRLKISKANILGEENYQSDLFWIPYILLITEMPQCPLKSYFDNLYQNNPTAYYTEIGKVKLDFHPGDFYFQELIKHEKEVRKQFLNLKAIKDKYQYVVSSVKLWSMNNLGQPQENFYNFHLKRWISEIQNQDFSYFQRERQKYFSYQQSKFNNFANVKSLKQILPDLTCKQEEYHQSVRSKRQFLLRKFQKSKINVDHLLKKR